MLFKDKVVLIIGGASGIGKAAALKMHDDGAKVVVADIDMQKIDSLNRMFTTGENNFMGTKTNISVKKEVEELVALVVSKFEKIDVLVNCAAVTYRKPLLEIVEEEWDKEFAVNMKGTFLTCQAVAEEMVKHKNGSIINVASINGVHAISNAGAYSSTKAGIIIFSRVIALELAKYNIRVNSISPGITDTELANYCFETYSKTEGTTIDEIRRNLSSQIPMNRFGKPEEVADLIMFLASINASYITGENFIISGGLTLRHL